MTGRYHNPCTFADMHTYYSKMCKWVMYHFINIICFVGYQRPSLRYLNRHVMKPVGSKWYKLGIDLLESGDVEELNKIRSQYPTDIDTCCIEMFQLWLNKQPTASWNQLIESLRCIDLDHLAGKIDQMLLQPKPAGVYVVYCILLIICSKKRSHCSRIALQLHKFFGEFLHMNTMKACKSW